MSISTPTPPVDNGAATILGAAMADHAQHHAQPCIPTPATMASPPDLPPLPETWYRHKPLYWFIRFILMAAFVTALMAYPNRPALTVPVTATIHRASLRDLSPLLVNWNYGYEYEIAGSKHKGSSYLYLGRYRPSTLDWLPQPGDQLRVYTSVEHPEESSIAPRLADLLTLIARFSVLFYFWFLILMLMLWNLCVALWRPAAAGLRHRVEPGRRVWVQLRWRGYALRPEVFFAHTNAFGLLFLCSMALSGPHIAYVLLLLGVGIFYAGRLADRAKCSTEIIADFQTGTLQVPCFDETAYLKDYNTPSPSRSLPLADASIFFVRSHGLPDSANRLLLCLLLADGEVIPVDINSSNLDEYGMQVLVNWLNEQLGFVQPPELMNEQNAEETLTCKASV